ncbi:YqcI/YcgG family protein [Haloglomus salinum]|jgi:FPC/CPF motif-containing protein YcgG|uniref:YqcI/YcgG family protein n=1 Tax=Haloglomus salinum TaxID=2962673 RepID=UPI0020C9BC1E|nr:YqcI/YcgG family protein [Haloglomus salinum]
MNEPGFQSVMDQATLAERVEAGEMPAWVERHWRTFRESLTGEHEGESFPCFFGAESVANGEPLYTAVPSTSDRDALLAFRDSLLEYLDVYEDREGRASFVVFFRPEADVQTEADYHEVLWHVLKVLHVHDPSPWPDDIPTETDSRFWEFCFGGEPMFPTCRAPFYDTYRSRYCPVGLEITFQPRTLFEGITADTEAGQRARETIQNNLERYDGVCPHANLGDWGVPGDREWHQYMLPEDESQAPDACPVTFSREHPKVDQRFDPVMPASGSAGD